MLNFLTLKSRNKILFFCSFHNQLGKMDHDARFFCHAFI